MGRGDLAEPVGLVRICDLAGRPRGTGFLADHEGTLVTSHEAVDGLTRVVLHAPGERTRLAEAEAITCPRPQLRKPRLLRDRGRATRHRLRGSLSADIA
ncbi:hypothetical protein ACIP27_29655, partial [Streptomyces hydrogenans]|uniref:hypothetical protein n=1 Tax=Streptomyces hydrogenans TaxID=1873719 RepID=UPI00382210A4